MATHVKNTGRVPKQVSLILKDGRKTCISVMPRTRKGITLPDGAKIDGNWLALEGDGILSWEDKVVESTPSPAPSTPDEAVAKEPEAAEADTKTENTQ